MKYKEWLETVKIEDENREAMRRRVENLRSALKELVPAEHEERKFFLNSPDHDSALCACDDCIALSLKVKDHPLVVPLISLAIQYLLDNFNCAACSYYCSYLGKDFSDASL